MNKAIIVGRLGRDPESRETRNGGQIVSLSVATNHRKKEGDEWVEATEWHRVKCFGRTADNVARYLTKGSECAVEGRIQTEKWTDKDGRDRYTTEIIAERVEFVGSRGEGRDAPAPRRAPAPRQTAAPAAIPF